MAYEEITRVFIKAGAALKDVLLSKVRANFEDHQGRILDLEALGLVVPTGVVLRRGSTTVPDGYLACDGAVVSRATYADLFGVIGTAFNIGGESGTEFRIPDLRGRTPIGAGTGSGLTARMLGARLGAETHALTISEMPAHGHSTVEPNSGQGHRHTPASTSDGVAGGAANVFSNNVGSWGSLHSGANTASTTPSISHATAGSGTAHNNMQPSLVTAYMIKT